MNLQAGEHGPYVRGDLQDYGGTLELGLVDGATMEDQRRGSGDVADLNLVRAQLGAGRWDDHDGHRNYGLHGSAESVQVGFNTDHGDISDEERLAFAGPNANLSLYLNEEMATTGFGATATSMSFSGETHDAEASDDSSWQFGLSAGPGAASRVHYGDEDGDGIPEMGFGGDIGFISFDLQSERVGELATGLRDQNPWVAEQVNNTWNSLFENDDSH